jgi:hypothetical protein
VVIHNLDVFGPCIRPSETNPPLRVDADAVLTGSLSAQRFQTISRWCRQIPQLGCVIQHLQFSLRCVFDVPKPPGAFAAIDGLGISASERLYRHGVTV